MIYDTNCLELRQISQIKVIVLHKTALISDTSHKFGELQDFTYFRSTLYKFGGSHDSLRFDNLLEQHTGLRKVPAMLLL